jgi:hypothetical protein
MTVRWLPGHRSPAGHGHRASLIHAECPIEQVVRSDDADVQQRLLREPWAARPAPGVLSLGDAGGLHLLAPSERDLDTAVERLRERFGRRVVADPPKVRLASGSPTLEPWMAVLVTAPARHLPALRADFVRRCGTSPQLRDGDPPVVEGEAPLARLLGYERALATLAPGSHASLVLTRYLPIDDGGPRAA